MIVLGNYEFVLGMKFCGIQESYAIQSREEALKILKTIDKNEVIIANSSLMDKVPELKEYPNIAPFPDKIQNFDNIDDLKFIIKTAIGIEVEGL